MTLTCCWVSGVVWSRFTHLITWNSGTGASWSAMSGRLMGRPWHWRLHLSLLPLGMHLEILQKRLTLDTRCGNSRYILLVSVLPFSDTYSQGNFGSIIVNMSQVST